MSVLFQVTLSKARVLTLAKTISFFLFLCLNDLEIRNFWEVKFRFFSAGKFALRKTLTNAKIVVSWLWKGPESIGQGPGRLIGSKVTDQSDLNPQKIRKTFPRIFSTKNQVCFGRPGLPNYFERKKLAHFNFILKVTLNQKLRIDFQVWHVMHFEKGENILIWPLKCPLTSSSLTFWCSWHKNIQAKKVTLNQKPKSSKHSWRRVSRNILFDFDLKIWPQKVVFGKWFFSFLNLAHFLAGNFDLYLRSNDLMNENLAPS